VFIDEGTGMSGKGMIQLVIIGEKLRQVGRSKLFTEYIINSPSIQANINTFELSYLFLPQSEFSC